MSKRGGLLLHQPNQLHWEEVLSRTRDLDIDPEVLRDAYFKIIPISRELLDIMIRLLSITAGEIVKTAVEVEQDKKKMALLEETLYGKYNFERFIGQSQAIQDVLKLVSRVIDSDVAILIEGETGTGKELLANLIHYNSPRRQRPFLPINCGGLTETLLESELFGHVKGAFTGAIRDKKGLFEVADGGTIFLDEIAETSPALQVKLLRVLQDGTFLPVGSTQHHKVNVRVISATNKDLKGAIAKGAFREDLYYRLNVVKIWLPPLRERRQDIPLLVEHFIKSSPSASKKGIDGVRSEALKVMLDYEWPGNIRELQNVLERAIAISGAGPLGLESLPGEILNYTRHRYFPQISSAKSYRRVKREILDALQREYLGEVLKDTNGNVTRAARLTGLSRAHLQELLKRHHIKPETFKR
jgi:transcriptional regulator with PAS, ATPase and Fis domain